MIPAFEENGYLPPGVHRATLDEIGARFGRETEVRRVQFPSLHWLVDLARRAGIARLVINGSFVTDLPEPNDVDCVLLVGEDVAADHGLQAEFDDGLPFLQIELATDEDFMIFVEHIFASDRDMIPKGVIEVVLWNSRPASRWRTPWRRSASSRSDAA